ncbi:MAG TPA: GDP-mannose 4,6-dehydratase, partial [Acidimicrobiia bacterium]|nr:GDP-mannose 4,6-dehydratase [Acidimicrobiia bacterium]
EVVGLDRAAGPDIVDAAAVRDVVARHRPDAVYHLAAVTHIGASWDAPLEVFRINAEGTFNVLSACAAAGVDRVLVVGSADEYGAVRSEDLPLSEDAPLRPLTPYGASKVAADYLALQAFLGGGLRVIRVRAFNHTGPTQSERFMIPGLARRIATAERENRKEIPIGSLEPVRDFTNVADVVAAYRLLIERGEPGEVYNVCSGVGHSVAEVAEHLLGLARHAIELVPDPALVRPVEVPRLVGDNRRLREATGWEPTIPFEETLASILERWRAEVPDR